MLDTIGELLYVIYMIILILIVIVVLVQLLWPGCSWSDFFGNSDKKSDPKGHDDFEDADGLPLGPAGTGIPDESEIESKNPEVAEYKRYNQNFKLESMGSPGNGAKTDLKEDQITAKDFGTLISNDEFLEEYLTSVKISFEDKLIYYTNLKKKTANEIALNRGTGTVGHNITGVHDSNVELMEIELKEFDDILLHLRRELKDVSTDKIKRNFKQILYNRKFGFASITGREDVKDFIVKQIYTFSRNPKVFMNNFENMRFYGSPGIGKSKLAECQGYIYSKSYMLARRKFKDTTSKHLTSQYVAESRRLTYKLLLSGLEGVIFIDEAYGLVDKMLLHDHGTEAITEMVKFLDKFQGKSIVILAGYKTQMETMLSSNDGLKDRYPHLFELSDYTSPQLTDILIKFINSQDDNLVIDKKDSNCIYTYIDYLYTTYKEVFSSQARSMKYLAQDILNTIYNSKNYQWNAGDQYLKTRAYLLLQGFNAYLKKYGVVITL